MTATPGRVTVSYLIPTPHRAGGLDHQLELAALVVGGQQVALLGGGEPAVLPMNRRHEAVAPHLTVGEDLQAGVALQRDRVQRRLVLDLAQPLGRDPPLRVLCLRRQQPGWAQQAPHVFGANLR